MRNSYLSVVAPKRIICSRCGEQYKAGHVCPDVDPVVEIVRDIWTRAEQAVDELLKTMRETRP